MDGDNPLWYDCDEEVPQTKTRSRIAHGARVMVILALLAIPYLACRFLV